MVIKHAASRIAACRKILRRSDEYELVHMTLEQIEADLIDVARRAPAQPTENYDSLDKDALLHEALTVLRAVDHEAARTSHYVSSGTRNAVAGLVRKLTAS